MQLRPIKLIVPETSMTRDQVCLTDQYGYRQREFNWGFVGRCSTQNGQSSFRKLPDPGWVVGNLESRLLKRVEQRETIRNIGQREFRENVVEPLRGRHGSFQNGRTHCDGLLGGSCGQNRQVRRVLAHAAECGLRLSPSEW